MTTYRNANEALPALLRQVLVDGQLTESRNGRTKELTMQQITLTAPSPAEITVPGRRVSLPAQIAETMWLLAGRNDIEWLQHYLPRAAEFSDDGKTWRGGYGPRLRAFRGAMNSDSCVGTVDQLAHVVDLLKEDPTTRRAVLAIYDPAIDTEPGKDIPCNNWVHLLPRDGVLHAHVAIRSNDLMWGWSGINSFEWTQLLTVVAGLTGLKRGSITFSISSLHLYEHHWDKARTILAQSQDTPLRHFTKPNPEFECDGGSLDTFDELVERWFKLEGQIRKGGLSDTLLHQVRNFPEPMLRSWLLVLLAWHHNDGELAQELQGTSLFAALAASPKRKVTPVAGALQQPTQSDRVHFTVFATKLHAEKNAAYGDSWKRRGEMLGIMANIARKVDRLGVPGGGDTAADTAIDLLVYLIKYNLWLRQQSGALDAPVVGQSHVHAVDRHLQYLETEGPRLDPLSNIDIIREITGKFDTLELYVEEKRASRATLVESLVQLAYPLAVRLWVAEGKEATVGHAERNATRAFNGYATTEELPA
jgi:thymidylate synthase